MPRPLLFVGDIHLGRRPSGLDDELRALRLAAADFSAAEAWRRAVAHARAARARAVVLAGDVVDAEQDRFEAYHHLHEGAEALREAGIPVFAVAGNHDVHVLPRLAAQVPGVRLLGAGGRWERVPLEDDGPPVDLLGWSFPSAKVRDDPSASPGLTAALEQIRTGASALGVLHGDLGRPTSHYAPIHPRNLEDPRVQAWFLGHIHAPHPMAAMRRPVGYLGSLVGLDPGEPGPRGPWEVEVDGAGGVRCRQLNLGPVRWDGVDVALAEDIAAVDDAMEAVRAAAAAYVRASSGEGTELLVLRARLTGRVAARKVVEQACRLGASERVFTAGGLPVVVEAIRDATSPAWDLNALSADPSPAGELARALLGLQREPPDAELLRWANARVEALCGATWDLGEDAPAPDPRALAVEACQVALDRLLATRAGGL